MTIDTRHLKRDDVVLTAGDERYTRRAIVDNPERYAPDRLIWRRVTSTEPVKVGGKGARRVHFTDGTSTVSAHSEGWIDQQATPAYGFPLTGSSVHLLDSYGATRTACGQLIGDAWYRSHYWTPTPGGSTVCRRCRRAR